MSKLTEEDLAKIYPRVKTYDEIHGEIERRMTERVPKFIAAKAACLTALSVPIIAAAYAFGSRIAASLITAADTMGVLAGVCFVTLLTLGGAVAVYYLWRQIESLTSKAVVATRALHAILALIVAVAIVGYMPLISAGYNQIVIIAGLTALVFVAAFAAVKFALSRQ